MHRAALDDAHWLSAASVVNETVGTRGHGLVLGNGTSPSDGVIVFWRLCFGGQRREDWERTYVRDYWHRDERLWPHIRSFVSVRQALAEAGALGASLHDLLDNTRTSVIQLDRGGRILAANDPARDIFRSGEALFAPGGFLRATRQAENAKLQRMLAEALPRFGVHGVAGSMAIQGSAPATILFVHIQPVGAESRGHDTHRVATLVLAVRPASPVWIKPDVVASAFGLTSTQSRIAVMLAAGRTVADIAAATGRKERTVRWHLQQIFRKQDITRQAELVRRVLSLQAIAGSREPEPPTGGGRAEN